MFDPEVIVDDLTNSEYGNQFMVALDDGDENAVIDLVYRRYGEEAAFQVSKYLFGYEE